MGETRGCHDGSDHRLKITSGIVPPRLQSLRVRRAGGRQSSPIRRAAGAIFVGETACQKRRAALLVIPIEPGPENTARVTGEVRPAIAADITLLLPVRAAQH